MPNYSLDSFTPLILPLSKQPPFSFHASLKYRFHRNKEAYDLSF